MNEDLSSVAYCYGNNEIVRSGFYQVNERPLKATANGGDFWEIWTFSTCHIIKTRHFDIFNPLENYVSAYFLTSIADFWRAKIRILAQNVHEWIFAYYNIVCTIFI
jgi:hypothetical protein